MPNLRYTNTLCERRRVRFIITIRSLVSNVWLWTFIWGQWSRACMRWLRSRSKRYKSIDLDAIFIAPKISSKLCVYAKHWSQIADRKKKSRALFIYAAQTTAATTTTPTTPSATMNTSTRILKIEEAKPKIGYVFAVRINVCRMRKHRTEEENEIWWAGR